MSAQVAPPRPAPEIEAAGPRQRTPAELMKLVTSIGSPIALATALLFYFGWVRSEQQARAFGADASVFDMSTQDYVLRSVNVLFFPVILLLLAGLLVLRLDRFVRGGSLGVSLLGRLARALRYSWAAMLVLAVLTLALAPEVGEVVLPLFVTLAILGPVYGIALGRLATGDPRRLSSSAVGLLATLVTVSLFWQTERLARLGGDVLAQAIQDDLRGQLESVRVLSEKDLHLSGPGVTERRLPGVDSAYAFEYTGLFLLQRSGDKYFLVTDGWDRRSGRLVVLADDKSTRLEFGQRLG